MSGDRGDPEHAWVYEQIVRTVPGITTPGTALAAQFIGFEAAVLILAMWYGLPAAAVAGTVAVVVAVAGSAFMLWTANTIRSEAVPPAYRRLLLGSGIDVVFGLVAFCGLLVYLFVYDPGRAGPGLLDALLGDRPPLVAVFGFLVIGWDLTYRIGVGWWASVVGLWRSHRFGPELPASTRARLQRIDAVSIGYATLQLLLVPILAGNPLLQLAIVGHVVAVMVVSGTSILLLARHG